MKTDKLFFRLFSHHPNLLLELTGLPAPYPPGYRQQALELKETGFRLDGLLRPPNDDWPYLFWEAQFQPDSGFYARWLASLFVCLHQQGIRRWRGVVVFPSRSVDIGATEAYATLLEQGPIQRVYLDELPPASLADTGHALLRLTITPPVDAPALARRLIATDPRPAGLSRSEVLDLVEMVLIYKLPHLSREEIGKMLHLPTTDLHKTRFYQEVFGEGRVEGRVAGRVEGRVAGRVEGRVEGRAEGRTEEAVRLILRQLNKRLGLLPADTESQIRGLPLERIEALAEALLDFDHNADLDRWLLDKD